MTSGPRLRGDERTESEGKLTWRSNTAGRSNTGPASSRSSRRPHLPLDLSHRPRRLRQTDWSRRMVRENVLTADDLIWPIFVVDGEGRAHAGPLDAGRRPALDRARPCATPNAAAKLAHPLRSRSFPTPIPGCATRPAREALNPDNLVCRAVRAIKAAVPEVGILVRRRARSLSPATAMTACCATARSSTTRPSSVLAAAGAGAGRGRLRHHRALRHDGRPGRRDPRGARRCRASATSPIMAYAAKYASAFYGPFRDAVGSAKTLTGDKRTYQMDSGQFRRGAARGRARHRRRRRHGDGQARPALSRHRAPREDTTSACRPSPIRCPANTR